MLFHKKKLSLFVSAISALGVSAFAPSLAFAQETANAATEEVLVTGFRAAQAAALDNKRNSANSVESIIAEDIGKMPDLNLAESLQRSPGIAITREGGEGRQITVRGLGPTYTRVTLNGMEVPASTGGLDSSGGVNRGRSFDFNMFSSDLFRQIDINKNTKASIEEGGLAATVELYSMRPLDKAGFNANGSIQTAYNVQTGEMDPRLTAIVSNSFYDDTVGVLVGVNWSQRTVHQEGFGTVRWTGPASNFRGDDHVGHGWADNTANITGSPNPSANYPDYADIQAAHPELTPLDYMWAPRLPRMDSFNHDQERLGFLAAFQARPNDQLELNLNWMSSDRDADVESYNYFAQFRNTHNAITPTDVTLDPSGRYIVAGEFQNVTPRSESRGQFSESKFDQVVASASYDFSDTLRLDAMLGQATSKHSEEQYRYNITASEGHDFSYSFLADSDIAEMTYDFDITDPAFYNFTGPAHRQESVERENTTFKVDLTWDFDDNGSNVKGGFITNGRTIDSRFSDDAANLTDPGDVTSANTKNLRSVVDSFGDAIGGPSGFPKDWIVADFGVVRDLYNAGEWNPEPDDSRSYKVNEDTMGLYVEANYFIGPVTLNGGVRWVETTVSGNKSDLEQSYTNTLPVLNATYDALEDLKFRASYSQNIARPNPSNLSGAVQVTPINGNVNVANPGLKPETADNFDIGVEWYFAEESYVGFTYFTKTITDSITSETLENVTLPTEVADIVAEDPVYDPSSPAYDPSVIQPYDANAWNLTLSGNSDDEQELDGYEFAVNYVFPLGVGLFANYTTIDSDDIIEGVSENFYNYGVFYDDEMFGARLVVNNRDDYISDSTGSNGNAEHATTGPTRVDFAGSWNINEMFTLTLDIINLTNEKERLYTTGPVGDLDLIREYNTTGTEAILGLRVAF